MSNCSATPGCWVVGQNVTYIINFSTSFLFCKSKLFYNFLFCPNADFGVMRTHASSFSKDKGILSDAFIFGDFNKLK
ncbi:hypothetical protein SAMN05421730_1001406 [Anaerobium acetethylicum]|uniref:Uncharacterized protein n=1 Tax=Anaerobium acetethylicum TaxID=1619234 RepID=A0A1D3TPA0_9FIRM|nr:hypothetical protein SAMN05421730_1001406 [Anaerobium acetethylicum]